MLRRPLDEPGACGCVAVGSTINLGKVPPIAREHPGDGDGGWRIWIALRRLELVSDCARWPQEEAASWPMHHDQPRHH